MIKVKFRYPVPQKSNTYINDIKYYFQIAVLNLIRGKYRIKNPKFINHYPRIIFDEEKGEMMELVWGIEDHKPVIDERVFYITFEIDKINARKQGKVRKFLKDTDYLHNKHKEKK